MPYTKQTILTGDLITADWGNYIQNQYDEAKADLDAKLDPTAGHKHTGAAGDGPKIPATSIDLSVASALWNLTLFGDTSQTAVANGTITRSYSNISDVDTWISFGPTGSGCSIILTGLDSVPTDAKAILFDLYSYGDNTCQRNIKVRKYGSSEAAELGLCTSGGNYKHLPVIVKCDSSRKFEFYWQGTNAGSMRVELRVVGYFK